jgi:Cu/Ag efflux protein CusF
MPRRDDVKKVLISALLLGALAALPACRGGEGGGKPPAASARRYTVRGEIVTLPAPGAGPRQIAVRHEAIPDFADRDGKVVGMGAMVMPFELAPGVSAEGLREGDPVELVLAVDWAGPSLRVERLARLPAGTPLNLGR